MSTQNVYADRIMSDELIDTRRLVEHCTALHSTWRQYQVHAHSILTCRVNEWAGFNVPSTHYRSFRRRVFPVNHLHWYWQPNKNNQVTEHTNNTK